MSRRGRYEYVRRIRRKRSNDTYLAIKRTYRKTKKFLVFLVTAVIAFYCGTLTNIQSESLLRYAVSALALLATVFLLWRLPVIFRYFGKSKRKAKNNGAPTKTNSTSAKKAKGIPKVSKQKSSPELSQVSSSQKVDRVSRHRIRLEPGDSDLVTKQFWDDFWYTLPTGYKRLFALIGEYMCTKGEFPLLEQFKRFAKEREKQTTAHRIQLEPGDSDLIAKQFWNDFWETLPPGHKRLFALIGEYLFDKGEFPDFEQFKRFAKEREQRSHDSKKTG